MSEIFLQTKTLFVNKDPLVSVIITSYNRGNFIDKAIQSSLNQDYANIEIIVSDNCSTDNTPSVLEKYKEDKRVKYYVNDTNIGMIPNFKLATERTSGKYITYLSSDDYFCNDKFISLAVDLINKHLNIVLVAAKNATLFEDLNEVVEDATADIFQHEFMKGSDLFQQFPKCFAPGWGAVLMDREKLMATRVFESKAQSLDYEANLKIMLQGNVAFIKQPSYVWRKHSSQASGTMNFETIINNFDFIENVYSFAKQINAPVDIENWRLQVYYAYLNGVSRRMINQKGSIVKVMNCAKAKSNIHIKLLKEPKYFILFTIYKNYETLGPLLKVIYPSLYRSIEKDK
ncbi:glycosyltransferase family 2 protein [Ferruginibacter sp. SUN106]|uniref:glycosyltransferase family 2 protein n=1 Tax=Ferruginibacter sp. SUN106 TaxID=2978348 RepID=UPI003D36AACB